MDDPLSCSDCDTSHMDIVKGWDDRLLSAKIPQFFCRKLSYRALKKKFNKKRYSDIP